MLLLSLTDGKELISAFEYRRIPDLELGKLVKGLKLALQCPDVRRGHLLLTSDNTRVLGGGFCTENIVMDVGEESLVLRKRPVPESPSTFPFQPPKISKDGFDVGHISLSSGSSEALDTFSPPSQVSLLVLYHFSFLIADLAPCADSYPWCSWNKTTLPVRSVHGDKTPCRLYVWLSFSYRILCC
jgi:hypothetical protein